MVTKTREEYMDEMERLVEFIYKYKNFLFVDRVDFITFVKASDVEESRRFNLSDSETKKNYTSYYMGYCVSNSPSASLYLTNEESIATARNRIRSIRKLSKNPHVSLLAVKKNKEIDNIEEAKKAIYHASHIKELKERVLKKIEYCISIIDRTINLMWELFTKVLSANKI